METDYAAAGVGHLWSTAPPCTATPRRLARSAELSDVVAFGRDLAVSGPKCGYPGNAAPRLPHLRPCDRPETGPGDGAQRAVGGQGALRSRAAGGRCRRPRRRLRRHRAGAADQRERPRMAGPRHRRLRHRTVRPLVVRGPTVVGEGAAGAAGGAGGHARRCAHRAASARRSSCRPALGVPQGASRSVGGRSGGRSGAAERRGGGHGAQHRGQGAGPRCRTPDPQRMLADQILRESAARPSPATGRSW